eukprot:GHVL01023464.1.p1 GENE.GHVL01023464.1~~GHVL01023464.1.p1  ORF type:complete len:425 (-),score=62.94 GHVL01023464.1:493-1767(-)
MTFHFSAHRSTQIDLYSISDSINVSDTPHLSLDVSAEVGCWCPKTNRIAYYDGNKGVCLGSHPSFMDIKVMEESLNRSIKYLHFSNLGKHLAGWSEPKRGEPDDENVFVWDSHTGMLLFSILMRKVFRWPFFKWSSTEHLCCHIDNDDKNILSQSVLVYNGDSISSQPIKKLDIPNVETIELSPLCGGFSAQLAVSLVEISDIMEGDVKLQSVRSQLAKQKFEVIVAIYDLLSTSNDPVTRAVVGDVDSVELLWSCKGTSLLVFYHVEVDSSGKMYGGILRPGGGQVNPGEVRTLAGETTLEIQKVFLKRQATLSVVGVGGRLNRIRDHPQIRCKCHQIRPLGGQSQVHSHQVLISFLHPGGGMTYSQPICHMKIYLLCVHHQMKLSTWILVLICLKTDNCGMKYEKCRGYTRKRILLRGRIRW